MGQFRSEVGRRQHDQPLHRTVGDPVAVRRGYEAGADDFLNKPVDTPALILKVRVCLRHKSLHDALARSREEAQVVGQIMGQAWENQPGAMMWLHDQLVAMGLIESDSES